MGMENKCPSHSTAGLDKLDYPVVMGSVLFSATIFVVINILADILYGVVDPRVRLQ
jgi:ABC-type dipeptide/oligopeptide/nickel transport system permease component